MFEYGLSNNRKTILTGGAQSESNHTTEFAATSDTERGLQQIADALWELHGLLERYAPSWYTQQYDDKAASALRVVGRV